MFTTIEYLKSGTTKQKRAYDAITALGIMDALAAYTPLLCGTIPIGIDLEHSDLDMIMEVSDFTQFESDVRRLYSKRAGFALTRRHIDNTPVIKANFQFSGFEFELFGQDKPVLRQNAYLHMVIQNHLLEKDPSLREKILALKRMGYKTEPAFCQILGLEGDPYAQLLKWGQDNRIIW